MSAPLADIITDDVLQEARLARQLRETIARTGVDPESVLAEERIVSIACEGLRAGWVASLTIHAPTPAEVDERAEQLRLAGARVWSPPHDAAHGDRWWRHAGVELLRADGSRLDITITSPHVVMPCDLGRSS